MGKLIRLTEAARRLGVERQTLVNWSENGIIRIKKIQNSYYTDGDLIEQIGDFASDVEESRNRLEKLKREYSIEEHEVNRLRLGLLGERKELDDERRYLNLCVIGGIRSRFFMNILGFMECYGVLTSRESEILRQRLEGATLDEIAAKYGLVRERIRQIVVKAIRKSGDLTVINDKIDNLRFYQSEIEGYKLIIKELKEKLMVQEAEERKTQEEKNRELIESDEICRLFNSRLVDHNISVRALNCLKNAYGQYDGVETVGELCKMNKLDVMKLRNMGRKTYLELDEFLEGLGLTFGMDVDKIYKERVEKILLQEEQKVKQKCE